MSRSRRSAARSMCEAPREGAPRPDAGRGDASPVPAVLERVACLPAAALGAAMDSVARPPVPLALRRPSAEPGADGPDADAADAADVVDVGSPAGDASEAAGSSGEAVPSGAPV